MNLLHLQPKRSPYSELTYKYIDGDTGCGKTSWAKNTRIPRYLATGYSVMMVVPSIQLADEIQKSTKGKIRAIHSKNRSGEQNVLSEIIEVMNNFTKDHKPVAIAICEASYLNLTVFFDVARIRTDNWILIKDEPRDPLGITTIKISNDAKRVITRYLSKFEEIPDSKLLARPVLIDYNRKLSKEDNELLDQYKNHPMKMISILRRLANSPGLTLTEVMDQIQEEFDSKSFFLEFKDVDCEIFGKLSQFKLHLLNPHCEIRIDKDLYDNHNILKYSVFQLPSTYNMFEQAFFMKANFTDSFVYHQWKERGVKWESIDKEFEKMPTNRIKIHYRYSDESRWSSYFRNKDLGGGVTVFDEYLDWARDELSGKRFVYVLNNSYNNEDEKYNLPGGTRMPAECHGLNSFSTHTNILLAGSYLSSKQDEPFYHYYGTSTTDSAGLRQTQFYIQQIARTDIRNYRGTEDINVYVPTLNEALSLMVYYKDATLIDDDNNKIGKLDPNFNYQSLDEKLPTNNFAVLGSGVRGNVFTHDVMNPDPEDLLLNGMFFDESLGGNCKNPGDPHLKFIQDIQAHDVSSNGLNKKKDLKRYNEVKGSLPWVCAGVYNDGDALTREKCQGSKFIGFDLDDTDITDKEIEKVMKQFEYLIYTTFSHDTKSKTRRLRIILPFNRLCTISEHIRIKRWFFSRFNDICNPKGTKFKDRRDIGLDASKSDPWAKLFVPHKESKVTHIKRKNGSRTHPIDVDEILAQEPKLPKIQPPESNDIIWTSTLTGKPTVAENDTDENKLKRIMNVIDSMSPHDRSAKAVKVGGMMKKLSIEHHEYVFSELANRGVDKTALAQARKYSKST